jgi:Macrocin-O-methyltransferase (TylF)
MGVLRRVLRPLKTRLEWVTAASIESALDADAINITRARNRKAAQESAEFIECYMANVTCFDDRLKLLEFSVANTKIDGMYCEFGVYKGDSINVIAKLCQDEVHGFDSFDGLPEFWKQDVGKGAFRLDKLPSVKANVRLHKGWFSETLPAFIELHKDSIAFLHIDADLYSSAKTIFDLLADRIVVGTVIQFDEFFNYPGWQQGEYRAFQEYVDSQSVEFEYLGYTPFRQVAIRVAGLARLRGSSTNQARALPTSVEQRLSA